MNKVMTIFALAVMLVLTAGFVSATPPVCNNNGNCGGQETCSNCAADCGVCPPAPVCGDAVCNGAETCSTCAADCGACQPTCNGNSGSIWTTNGDCGDETQDVNHYAIGDKVYINGKNFCPDTYDWTIAGNPFKLEDQVASGNKVVDSTGAFCFEAYIVGPNDSGEYKVDFGKKGDNYRVDSNAPVVPEFGTTVGILTALGALGVFFLVRKK